MTTIKTTTNSAPDQVIRLRLLPAVELAAQLMLRTDTRREITVTYTKRAWVRFCIAPGLWPQFIVGNSPTLEKVLLARYAAGKRRRS